MPGSRGNEVLMKFMSVRFRQALLAGFGALLILLVIATVAGLLRIETINRHTQEIIHDQRIRTGLISNMMHVVRERSQIIYTLIGAEDPLAREEAYRRYRALTRDFAEGLQQLRKLELPPAEQSALRLVLASADRVRTVHDEIARLLMEHNVSEATQLLNTQGVAAQDEFQESLYPLLEAGRTAIVNGVAQTGMSTRYAFSLIIGVGVLVLLAGGFVAVLILRQALRTESALQFETELAQVTLHSIGDGVITTDADGKVEYLNPVAEQYTGWSTPEARGKPLAEIYRVIDEHLGNPAEPLQQDAGGASPDGGGTGSVRLLDRNGRECPIRYSQAPIRGRDGRILGMIVVFHDISQLRAMAQQLTWQASHDALTGLVNRREFERRLGELIETAKKGREHALMFMDLDNFKAVNDTCGHSAGDELLRQLTSVMMTRMRGSDTLARLGGDEFGALLESCPLDQALRIANAMRETVREFRFVWENKTFSVGVSIGLVPLTADSGDLNRVLVMADACCYDAKNKGRDRVQVHRQEDGEFSDKRGELQIVSQINRAFELSQFRLYRQRILPLNPEAEPGDHYEVLVRMLDASGNLVPPTAFMPAAERYNLLTSIERWVISSLVEFLHRRCSGGAIPQPAGLGSYSVNISGASINDKSFPDFLRNLLTRYQLPRGLLCFEITETTAISNLTRASELMREMKGMGCRFSLDDFGTGMSSFAYLKYLPVDYLKIAGMFIKDMAGDPMDYAIVDAINRISHILGMQTIAESVEDADALEKITALGIDFAQGYFIAEPEALEEDETKQLTEIAAAQEIPAS
jgi:diguanylate cyclase (GGDEF)-like protein/PAS domain S-box-containing protein